MNKKYTDILFKILLIIMSAIIGWFLFAVSANILLFTNAFSEEAIANNVGFNMTQKAINVWLVSLFLSGGVFIFKDKFRYFFLLLPLITPSIFAVLYAMKI